MNRIVIRLIFAALSVLLSSVNAWADSDPPLPGEYRVVAGKVDFGTYTGWRMFHSSCFSCHGVGAVGTDRAPNLVERIKTMTQREFATKVLTSYRISVPENGSGKPDADLDALIEQALRRDRRASGRILMPAWEEYPMVNAHVLDLYAYLLARAEGKLGPGRPQLLGHKR